MQKLSEMIFDTWLHCYYDASVVSLTCTFSNSYHHCGSGFWKHTCMSGEVFISMRWRVWLFI